MSAIGSVMVMDIRQPFSPWFHAGLRPADPENSAGFAGTWLSGGMRGRGPRMAFGEAVSLPGSLGHAGQLATVCHLADAHPAQAELAVDRLRPPTPLTAGVGAYREFRLARRLEDQRLLGHGSALLVQILTV